MAGKRKRIGILGGTFNPIHLGHLLIAQDAMEQMALDRVKFIPSATPPHKTAEALASERDRLQMLRLAIRGNDHFEVDDIEIRRGGISFTIDTVRVTWVSINSGCRNVARTSIRVPRLGARATRPRSWWAPFAKPWKSALPTVERHFAISWMPRERRGRICKHCLFTDVKESCALLAAVAFVALWMRDVRPSTVRTVRKDRKPGLLSLCCLAAGRNRRPRYRRPNNRSRGL